MRILPPRRPPAPPTDAITRFYLQYGHRPNAHSVAFDPDFERYVSPLGVVAHARCAALGTTMCYFEPLCAAKDLPALVDEWLVAMEGEHVGFWKASRPLAEVLACRGFRLAAYGTEHEVDAPPSLAGSAMRGLRRQVDKARNAGVVVTPIAADTAPNDPVWREIEELNSRWLASRACRFPIRRLTRRYDRQRVEPHTTRLCARRVSDGRLVGWCCLDHMFRAGQLSGVGLSAVRWDPEQGGVAALLAVEGAQLLAADGAAPQAAPPLTLALGESPLAVRPEEAREDGWEGVGGVAWSRALELLFGVLHKRANRVYNTRGLSGWKAKWRPASSTASSTATTYVAVDARRPWRHVLTVLWLAVWGDNQRSVEALGSDRYRASIAPLRFPGLTVEVVALIHIERIDAGLRYTTEGVRLNFTGMFRSAMVGVEELCDVAAVTELRACDGELAATGTFSLELPLPRWIPERATAAGERLIQSIVAKDTRLTIERLQAEMDAGRVGAGT